MPNIGGSIAAVGDTTGACLLTLLLAAVRRGSEQIRRGMRV